MIPVLPHRDLRLRELVKEAQKITDRIGVKVTKNDPDYWGLASVMTEDEVAVTRVMKVRVPQTFAQLKEATHLDDGVLQDLLDSLSVKGIIEYNWENLDGKNPQHEKRYVLPCLFLVLRSLPL